jgi:hypothetical protein
MREEIRNPIGLFPQLATLLCAFVAFFVALPAQAQQEPVAALDAYVSFLSGQGLAGPPDLVNQTITEDNGSIFSISYTATNVAIDVRQVNVFLWRVQDDQGDRHFEGVDSWFLPPAAIMAGPVTFTGLKRGEAYGIHLTVVTAMPSILSGQADPDAEIHVKTIYLLWPHGQSLLGTAEDGYFPFQGERRLFLKAANG